MAQGARGFSRLAGARLSTADNGVALASRRFSEVRTKKPGSAGDKYAHVNSLCSKMNLQQCVSGVSQVDVVSSANSHKARLALFNLLHHQLAWFALLRLVACRAAHAHIRETVIIIFRGL